MKKIIFFATCLLIIIGCTTNRSLYFNRYTEEIEEIKYNDITLVKEDYQSINDILENIEFNDKAIINLNSPYSTIDITTIENEDHHFYIYPDNVIKYVVNNNTYYAKDDTAKIIELYNDIKDKYSSTNFYTINYMPNYTNTDDKDIINIKDANEAIIFKVAADIYDLKVYTVEGTCDCNRGDPIYESKEILKDNELIFKLPIKNTNTRFQIVFNSKYNYRITNTIQYNSDIKDIKMIITTTKLTN